MTHLLLAEDDPLALARLLDRRNQTEQKTGDERDSELQTASTEASIQI